MFFSSSKFSCLTRLGREEIMEIYDMYFLQDKHFNYTLLHEKSCTCSSHEVEAEEVGSCLTESKAESRGQRRVSKVIKVF